MQSEDKIYLLKKANPCNPNCDETYLGVFTNILEMIKNYTEAKINLENLQKQGRYENYDIYIVRFDKNKANDPGLYISNEDINLEL